MSYLDKLAGRTRKPVAVIMSALLVASSTPLVPFGPTAPQVVYAVEEGADQEAKASNHATSEAWGDLSTNITFTYDSHPSKGEDGTGSVTFTTQDVLNFISSKIGDQADSGLLAQFTYTAGGKNAFSQEIDAALAKIDEGNKAGEKTSKTDDGNTVETTNSNAKIKDGSIAYQITGGVFTVKDGNGAIKAEDGTYTVSGDEEFSKNLTITVTSLTYEYKFDYTYTQTVVTTPAAPDPGDGGTTEGGTTEGGTTEGGTTEGGTTEGGTTEGGTGGATDPVDPPASETKTEDKTGTFPEQVEGETTYQSTTVADESKKPTVELSSEVIFMTDGAITATDYWDGAGAAIVAKLPCDTDGLVFEGAAVSQDLFTTKSGLTGTVSYDDESDKYFDATVSEQKGAYNLSITPKHAFTGGKDITIAWTYPDGTSAGSTTVTVDHINKKEVDLSTIEVTLPYRLANDSKQLDDIKDQLNEGIEKLTTPSAEGAAAEAVDFVSGVTGITDTETYYGTPESGATIKATGYSVAHGDLGSVDDYSFATNVDGSLKLPCLTVKNLDVLDWSKGKATGLTLDGKSLNDVKLNGTNLGTWVRNQPTASWSGGKISSQSATLGNDLADDLNGTTTFGATLGQGKQTASFYVQDADGTLHRINNVSYKYDSVAPTLTSFNAVPVGKDVRTSDKKVWAAKNMDVKIVASESAETDTSSGMNNISGSYKEQKSGGYEEVKGISKEKSGAYSFSISADSKVSTKSIKVDLTDNAGNVSKNLGYTDASTNIDVAELMAMTTAPTVSTAWSTSDASNGHYYNQNRTLTITLHAPFFEYAQQYQGDQAITQISRNGKVTNTVKPGDFKKVDDDTWQCTLSFTEDADWEVGAIQFTDLLGRSATAPGDSFTIDKTAPTMQVSFDNNDVVNGKYYAAARTATITVTEHNFDPALVHIEPTAGAGNGTEVGQPAISGWNTSGDVHTATVTFPGQGVYTLSVDGQDLATNAMASYTCPEFVVDTTKPEIEINDVSNKTAYAGAISPEASIHDTNLDGSASSIEVTPVGFSSIESSATNPFTTKPGTTATDMTVSYDNPERVRANDGVYTIMVTAKDLAGNSDTKAVTWSVNRFGSTYVIGDATGEMLDKYLKSKNLVNVQVTEINPSGLDSAQTSVELTRDTKNTTLKADKDYQTKADGTSGWSEYTYTVDKSNYEKKDGVYRVLFHSQDAAGNVSENTMEGKNAKKSGATAEVNFAVDDTKPTVTFQSLTPEEGKAAIEEASHTGKVTFDDNIKLDHAVIKVNGKTVAKLDAKALADNPVQEVKLDQSSSEQTVTAVAYDAAGNKSDEKDGTIKVLVTTDAFTLWLHNTPLMVGTFVVIAALVGGGVFLVGKRRKGKDDGAAA